MGRIIKSRTRAKELRRVLPHSELNMHIGRLAVLFEDLRIEMYAASHRRKLASLDYTHSGYRRLYFLRRAIATLIEFIGTLEKLNQRPEFQDIKKRFSSEETSQWDAGIAFFAQHKEMFKTVRNDIGGHFQQSIVAYALENAGAKTMAKMSIVVGSNDGAGPKLNFAADIVAIAFTKHKGDRTEREFFEYLLKLFIQGMGHATMAVHLISAYYLWQRFE
jgi:hypothetical protein